MTISKTSPSWWDDCENCNFKVHTGHLCENCGVRNSKNEHTHMAYDNTEEAGNFAIVMDNLQWCDERNASDRFGWAMKECVYATLRTADLPFNEEV